MKSAGRSKRPTANRSICRSPACSRRRARKPGLRILALPISKNGSAVCSVKCEADANVWRTAKAQFVGFCVKAAANRLKNRDFLKRNPQIEDIVIDRPIFIVGLPRSGTTHLENLIAADRRLRYLPVYLGSEATPTPGEKPGTGGKDPRWLRSSAHWERMRSEPDHGSLARAFAGPCLR